MSECELIRQCKFFNDKLPRMPEYAELMKNVYCRDDFASCARFAVYKVKGIQSVPADLFPNEPQKARLILGPARK